MYKISDTLHNIAKVLSQPIRTAFRLKEKKREPLWILTSYNQRGCLELKNWISNTVEDKLAKQDTEILEVKKDDVEKIVASNAFILIEVLENAEKRSLLK